MVCEKLAKLNHKVLCRRLLNFEPYSDVKYMSKAQSNNFIHDDYHLLGDDTVWLL
jgi:hypothetical protein